MADTINDDLSYNSDEKEEEEEKKIVEEDFNRLVNNQE